MRSSLEAAAGVAASSETAPVCSVLQLFSLRNDGVLVVPLVVDVFLTAT